MSNLFQYLTQNPKAIRKFLIAIAAAIGVLIAALSDNLVTTTEWLQVILGFLGGIGVYAIPNDTAP